MTVARLRATRHRPRWLHVAALGVIAVGAMPATSAAGQAAPGRELTFLGYPAGPQPQPTASCNLDERINVVSLRDPLEAAITFDPAETTLAGAWRPAAGRRSVPGAESVTVTSSGTVTSSFEPGRRP